MKKGFFFLLLAFMHIGLFAHSGKAKYHAIVDMDNSISSLNALTLVLANNEIEVLAILTSDEDTRTNVAGYLKSFYHEGIPVSVVSAKEENTKKKLLGIFENEPDSITYIDFNGLRNISLLVGIDREISKLNLFIGHWGEVPFLKRDREYIDILAKKGVSFCFLKDHKFSNSIIPNLNLDTVYNPYAINFVRNVQRNGGYFQVSSELIPLYLKANSYFTLKNGRFIEFTGNEAEAIELFELVFKEETARENKVFSSFPTDKNMFAEDVGEIMEGIIQKYGFSEWRACVITNELHGHLGIYAVVGAKMGIRVREYFRVGVDDIFITSFAGNTPPFSCLNDGLQVSTGGTVGHGLIELGETTKPRPAATFGFKNHKVSMELKPEYWDQIKKDIGHGVKTYGLGTEKYWSYVRKLALKYWHDWDRHLIFMIN